MRIRSDKTTHGFVRNSYWQRLIFWSGTALGIAWALPLTLLGILLTLPILARGGNLSLIGMPTPALLVSGSLADYLLDHHPYGAMCAMAIGHIVIANRRDLTSRILIHELAHVRQAACWGAAFPFVYLAASGWALLHGRDAYWHNVFEVAAREAEQHG